MTEPVTIVAAIAAVAAVAPVSADADGQPLTAERVVRFRLRAETPRRIVARARALRHGGFYLGADSAGFKFGAARNSDGAMQETPGTGLFTFSQYQGRFIDRVFLLSMYVTGTLASCYINGELAGTLTLTGGFRQALIGNIPMIGRNINVTFPYHNTTLAFVAGAYDPNTLYSTTESMAKTQARAWLRNGRIMANSLDIYSPTRMRDIWSVAGTTGAIVTEKGALSWTRVGSIYASTNVDMPWRLP